MRKATTLGELKSQLQSGDARSVKDELRRNLIRALQNGEGLFPGIIGYEESVIPEVVNAILSRHNFILLGLRGQAKSRILRGLVHFLDETVPAVEECEIRDHPFAPICGSCRRRVADMGDQLPVRWVPRDERYVEKLATPDVTIADMIGDLDPIKAARQGRDLADHENMHFGLLPRAHRGIFAVNELPDLAPKIQVGLFNIMQEGDVQIKGFPVRLPLDILLVFSANPEDYTARGKIVTPLKDRIGSEIRTHYPALVEHGVKITQQESWVHRPDGVDLKLPGFIHDIVERIAFAGRADKRVDRTSGVSQRLPISCLENTLSNTERRTLAGKRQTGVVRVSDIYAAIPAITGKLELEYEGEMKGADRVARDLIQLAVRQTFEKHFGDENLDQIVQWFEIGGEVKVTEDTPAPEYLERVGDIQGLSELIERRGLDTAEPEQVVAVVEFVLEGLASQKRLSRNEERGYFLEVKRPEEEFFGDLDLKRKRRRPFN